MALELDAVYKSDERFMRFISNWDFSELVSEFYDLQLCYQILDDAGVTPGGPGFLDFMDWYEQYLLHEIAGRACANELGKRPATFPALTGKPNTGCPLGGVDVAHHVSGAAVEICGEV